MADYEAYINELTGYNMTDEDTELIKVLEAAEKQHILNFINQTTLPDELEPVLLDVVTGRFLACKKSAVLGSTDLSVVKAITEGDVTVNLGGTSPEARLDALIAELTRERDLICFRKLRW